MPWITRIVAARGGTTYGFVNCLATTPIPLLSAMLKLRKGDEHITHGLG
jgi:hypothetical protein